MSIILNIAIIGLVLLIAYWWSQQGFFSALLHLMAVIAAGALALAFWEPLAIDVLLSGGTFDGYAMGLSLAGLFAIFLLILRGVSDTVIRANIMLPPGPDIALGGVMGLIAGIVTIGLTLTSLGFFHGPHELMGYQGYGRARGQAGMMEQVGPPLWVPVDRWTNELYDWMSVSTLYPNIGGSPLKQFNPELFKQASLLRDNMNDGQGQISMPPNGVGTLQVFRPAASPYIVVLAPFNASAMDFGRQLTLASSQVRMVGKAAGNKKPTIIHPVAWMQELPDVPEGTPQSPFSFDDRQNYATSVPGRKDAMITFLFEAPGTEFEPAYVQIRGTRFETPPSEDLPGGSMAIAMLLSGNSSESDTRRLGGPIGEEYILLMERVPGFRPSLNRVPGTMNMIDGKFESGFLRLPKSSPGSTSRSLEVSGIYSSQGASIVYVNVSRTSPLYLGGQVEDRAGVGDEIKLIDSSGRKYTPIGYVYKFGNEVEIQLDPRDGLKTIPQLPILSRSQAQDLLLVFEVTGGVKITSMRVGHTLIGTMDVDVPAR